MGISFKTACTYFYQWKKLPREFDSKYRNMKRILQRNPHALDRFIKEIAADLGEPEKKIKAQLETPWGIHQLVAGKYKKYIRDKEAAIGRQRIEAAVKIIRLHENLGVPLDKITEAFEKLSKEYESKRMDSLKKLINTLKKQ